MSSSISFVVTKVPTQSDLAPGTTNDAAENVLRKFLNSTLKGRAWDAMIHALAAGDAKNWDNAAAAFDQLYITSASEGYLDRRTSDYGEVRPASVGMSDDLYRKLAIIKKTKKLTQEAFLEVLEIFYGPDAVRASTTANISEPYSLNDLDTLDLLLDEKVHVTVTFERATFGQIDSARALEVAGAINRALREAGSQAYAISYTDPTTGSNYVRIYSGSLGLSSSIRIIGGSGQRSLQFPAVLFTGAGFVPTNWVVSKSPTAGLTRFTGGQGVFDLDVVRQGDFVYIFSDDPSDPFYAAGIQGVFPVENVSTYYIVENPAAPRAQYFEIPLSNPPTGTYLQSQFDALMFFRPTKRTIYDQPRHVVVNQGGKVVLPATTQAVQRRPGTAAYLNGQTPQTVSSLVRTPDNVVTVVTADPHGLVVGDQINIEAVVPVGARPTVTPGTPSGGYVSNLANGVTDASLSTTLSATGTFAGTEHRALRLPEGSLMMVGGKTVSGLSSTPIAHPTIFHILSEAILTDGSRQQTYQWKNLASHTFTIGARAFGTTLMADGRVLATGGTNGDDVSGTTKNNWDIFAYSTTPAIDTQISGTMPAAVAGHAQCSLPDNTALICGGFNAAATPITTARLFNGDTLSWTTKASMHTARMHHEAVVIGPTLVLVMGGTVAAGVALNTCEIYDSNTNTWSKTGSMTFARFAFTPMLLPDGRVLVVGGYGYNPTQGSSAVALKTCEIYDPATGFWSPVPPMSVGREYPIVVYVPNRNAVYVLGGVGNRTMEILDLATMRWSRSIATIPAGPTIPGLQQSAGALVGTDGILVAGGTDSGNTGLFNYVVIPGAEKFYAGDLNREASVATVASSTKFTYKLAAKAGEVVVTARAGVTVSAAKAQAAPAGVPGPFAYDPKTGLAVTGTVATLGQDIAAGQTYAELQLDTGTDANPALSFPDEPGYLVFNFGFKGQIGPVKYLGRFDNEALVLDSKFKFPSNLTAGVTVTLLKSNSPFEPPTNELTGSFYATGSAAGRVAAEAALDDIAAAGFDYQRSVVYPGDAGLGNQGRPTISAQKLSDATEVWGGDDLDTEIPAIREGNE
jgi:hypothetical protein